MINFQIYSLQFRDKQENSKGIASEDWKYSDDTTLNTWDVSPESLDEKWRVSQTNTYLLLENNYNPSWITYFNIIKSK